MIDLKIEVTQKLNKQSKCVFLIIIVMLIMTNAIIIIIIFAAASPSAQFTQMLQKLLWNCQTYLFKSYLICQQNVIIILLHCEQEECSVALIVIWNLIKSMHILESTLLMFIQQLLKEFTNDQLYLEVSLIKFVFHSMSDTEQNCQSLQQQ